MLSRDQIIDAMTELIKERRHLMNTARFRKMFKIFFLQREIITYASVLGYRFTGKGDSDECRFIRSVTNDLEIIDI